MKELEEVTDTRKAVRVKRSKNQSLGWESNPDRQICALMLCRVCLQFGFAPRLKMLSAF